MHLFLFFLFRVSVLSSDLQANKGLNGPKLTRRVLSAPTLVTCVGELVAEMRARDTGKAEEEAGKEEEEEEEEEEERGGRRALEQLPLATRPRSLISQSDLGPGDTTAHNAIQQQLFQHEPASPFFPFTTAARAGQPLEPFFRLTLRGLFQSAPPGIGDRFWA